MFNLFYLLFTVLSLSMSNRIPHFYGNFGNFIVIYENETLELKPNKYHLRVLFYIEYAIFIPKYLR